MSPARIYPKRKEIQKWEYLIKIDDGINSSNKDSVTDLLNHGGNQGWELTASYPLNVIANVYIFKRLKPH